jgi:DNA-binding transcriptional LysR family regulator
MHALGPQPGSERSKSRTCRQVGPSGWRYSTQEVDTLTSIKVFRKIIEAGSFIAAAERLDLSAAMVSKHVMHIERRLGVRLLYRNSHTLSLTEPGRLYFECCKTILDDLEATEQQLSSMSSLARGTLRMSVPSWFIGQWPADLLARFRARYPEIVLDVSFEDGTVDLVEGGYDLALRVTASSNSLPAGVVARSLRPIAHHVAASRQYVQRCGAPKCFAELASHDCVAVGSMESWVIDAPTGRVEVPARIVLRYRSMAGVAQAVAAGVGIALLPGFYFEDPAYGDTLVRVLPDAPLESPMLYVLYASRAYVPLKIRAFIEFIQEELATMRAPKGGSAKHLAPLPPQAARACTRSSAALTDFSAASGPNATPSAAMTSTSVRPMKASTALR